MRTEDLPLWDIQEYLTTKEDIDAYEKALVVALISGESLEGDEFAIKVRRDISIARKRLEERA